MKQIPFIGIYFSSILFVLFSATCIAQNSIFSNSNNAIEQTNTEHTKAEKNPAHMFSNQGSVAAPEVFITITDIKCAGERNGIIHIAMNGIKPFNVGFSAGCNQEAQKNTKTLKTQTATYRGLSQGWYTLAVVDGNGVAVDTCVYVGETKSLNVDVAFAPVVCFYETTRVHFTARGGTPPYSLFREDGSIITTFEKHITWELGKGSYNWTVTDANNCLPKTVAFDILTSEPFSLQIEQVADIFCHDDTNGLIEVAAEGLSTAYTYTINGEQPQPNGLFENLVLGDYIIAAADENGCIVESETITLGNTDMLSLHIVSTTDVSCLGRNDGTITAEVSGGIGPYYVSLHPECNDNNKSEHLPYDKSQGMMYWGLQPGWYRVKVIDQLGCEASECVFIDINQMVVNHTVEPTCQTADNTISFINPGLQNIDTAAINWSFSDQTTHTGLSSLEILDATAAVTAYSNYSNGILGEITHTGTRGIGISGGGSNEIDSSKRLVIDFNEAVYLSGFEIRSFFIFGYPRQHEQGKVLLYLDGEPFDEIHLMAEQYYGGAGVLVTTMNQPVWVDRMEFYIPEDKPYSNFSGYTVARINLLEVVPLANIILDVDGDASPFSYVWSNGATSKDLLLASPGNYSVVISDSNDCSQVYAINAMVDCEDFGRHANPTGYIADKEVHNTKSAQQETNSSYLLANGTVAGIIKAFPNPFTSETNIAFQVTENSNAIIEVFNLAGERVALLYQGEILEGETHQLIFRPQGLPGGIYFLRMLTSGSIVTEKLIITR